MSDERICSQCHNPLDPDTEGTVCKACLMQVGFESVDQNLDHVSSEPPSDNPTEVEQEETLEKIQSLFPDLEVLERIGQGGMGVVYKARQKHLGRLVAVKILRAKLSGDPTLAERFTREARALAKLSHPNIVGVHDFGQAGDRPYLIMEYVDGTSLREMILHKTMSPKEALALVPHICDALQFAHEEGIVHRDIKPENILVDRRGRVRIADFGLARLTTRTKEEWTLTGTRQVMGTPHYMAPEQMDRPQEVDHRADIYSLGVVIYEMLTGELPIGRFELPSRKVQVDVRLDDVVLRTLENEPSRRYQSVTDVQTDMQRISSSQPSTNGFPIHYKKLESIAPAGLFTAAAIDVIVFIWNWTVYFGRRSNDDYFVIGGVHFLFACLVAYGAWHMLNRNSWRWAMAASIITLIPFHFGIIVGLPFAIWSLIILLRPDTAARFSTGPAMSSVNVQQTLNKGSGMIQTHAANVMHLASGAAVGFAHNVSHYPWQLWLKGLLACCLWALICAGISGGLFLLYGRSRFPTFMQLGDYSASNVRFVSNDRYRLNISAETYKHNVKGFEPTQDQLQFQHIYFAVKQVRNNLDSNPYPNSNSPQYIAGPTMHILRNNVGGLEYSFIQGIDPSLSRYRSPAPIVAGVPIHRYGSSNYEYLPTLTDSKPIESWLVTLGMDPEKTSADAESLHSLVTKLINRENQVVDLLGDIRLKPISSMLDPERFQSAGADGILVRLDPEEWAISTWIGTTIAAGLLGIVFIGYRTLRRRSESGTSVGPEQVSAVSVHNPNS